MANNVELNERKGDVKIVAKLDKAAKNAGNSSTGKASFEYDCDGCIAQKSKACAELLFVVPLSGHQTCQIASGCRGNFT